MFVILHHGEFLSTSIRILHTLIPPNDLIDSAAHTVFCGPDDRLRTPCYRQGCGQGTLWAGHFLETACVDADIIACVNRVISLIIVTLYERHGVSNHQQLDCLINSLYRLTTNKHQGSTSLVFCEKNQPVTDSFSSQNVSNAESVSMLSFHHMLPCMSEIISKIIICYWINVSIIIFSW